MRKFIFIFIMGFSLYADKSGIGIYKDGKKVQKKVTSENVMGNRVNYQNDIRERILSFAKSKLGSRYV